MKKLIIGLTMILMSVNLSFAQESTTEQEIKELSKAKWQWMADKNVDKLETLFHNKSKFVHMSGTWNKDWELEIIETGSIWYKQADVHDVVVEVFDNTAVLWNRITLMAHVRGEDVSNEFTVTEIYKKEGNSWKLLDLTFSSVRDTHQIAPNANPEQIIKELSKAKWQWMADKNTDKLENLFHENSVFVHMGGSWGKDREIEIIRSGGIHYKKADIHEVSVNVIENTAILLNRISLLAEVGGNEVTNPFMVTEVYKQENGDWKLASLSFTKLLESE
ncbi:nuclear transport factor 2 family protein [Draconibacterium sediminis]|uniref:nuclear transport factor 2 family protein n=1 Tax=Draconibacterium sediminis TaxID=1544798 RepID=UPI0009E620C7|nr:nuclear transport factor 2 family protein [Draconibacterium sediminis]